MLNLGKEHLTFADIMASPDTEWVEIIHGKLYPLIPLGDAHQRVLMSLSAQLWNQLRGSSAQMSSLLAVRPYERLNDKPHMVDTVLLPDVSILLAPRKFEEYGCRGVPNYVAEVISPSSRYLDTVTKFEIYQGAGVKEYWIVDPEKKNVKVYILDANSGKFQLANDTNDEGMIPVSLLSGIFVDVREMFD
ncbi:MAG: Uma2 family endonuclease [Roseburia sp.]|nr:Uma2 family endonuclease [Lachnospiraceae bacterium]MCM1568880.1 Uma2 family endonuclease [Roseburia sp.]